MKLSLNTWAFQKYKILPELWNIIMAYKHGFEEWELYCMYSRMVVQSWNLRLST